MEEASQQAVSLGVNITIFIVALTISLTLMFAVRDIADVAATIDDSVPDGSMVLSVEEKDARILDGYEIVSYYYNYIKPYYVDEENNYEYNHPNVGVVIKTKDDTFKKEIINGDVSDLEIENNNIDFNNLKDEIDLNAKYTLTVKNHYDNTGVISGTTVIYIEQIPELSKGEIYSYYINEVKENFIEPNSNNKLFADSKLNIMTKNNGEYDSIVVDVNEDSKKNNKQVQNVINSLNSTKKYFVRIKRNNLTIDMKSSSITLYIEETI